MKKIFDMFMPDFESIFEVGILLGVSFVVAFSIYFVHPNTLHLLKKCDVNKVIREKFEDLDIEISTEQAFNLFNMKIQFIDARDSEHYSEKHIKGAYSFPIDGATENMAEFIEKFPQNTQLIIYCSGVDCPDSHNLFALLLEVGYINCKIYTGGLPEWEENDYPTEGDE